MAKKAPTRGILVSNDYEMFELTPFNRDIGQTILLENSMRKWGFLDAFPLYCVESPNGKLKIKDGHHRFVVAKKLGTPVKYVIETDGPSMHQLIAATSSWSMADFLASYCKAGFEQYLAVRDYHNRTGITLSMCLSLLGGQTGAGGNLIPAFKDGTYSIRDQPFADDVASIVAAARTHVPEVATRTNFVSALAKAMIVEEFKATRFLHKMEKFPFKLREPASTVVDYISNINTAYNHATKDKIPLPFLIEAAMKARNPKYERRTLAR